MKVELCEQPIVRICKAPNCGNTLLKRQRLYCSRKCSSTDPQRRKSCSNALKKSWQKQDFREKQGAGHRKANKLMWQNPEYKAKMSDISRQNMKKLFENKEFLKEHRERAIAICKKNWADSSFREKMIKIQSNREFAANWNALKVYKSQGQDKCYLYLILFNNKNERFFKIGVSKNKYRPRQIAAKANVFTTKVRYLAYDRVEKLCTAEHNLHFKLGLPHYEQGFVKNGKTEIYAIKDLRTAYNYIKRAIK